jgi:hypothetical protein
MTKKTKHDVVYSKGMKAAHCSICEHYQPKPHTCTKVEGIIDPDYWCKLWTKRIGK